MIVVWNIRIRNTDASMCDVQRYIVLVIHTVTYCIEYGVYIFLEEGGIREAGLQAGYRPDRLVRNQ